VTKKAIVKAEVVTDTDGAIWVLWGDNPQRPFEFHTLKLTNEHGELLAD
jgi:hypothetical protein